MNIIYRIKLDAEECASLNALLSRGHATVRRVKRAQSLLAADRGLSDEVIATSLGVGTATVSRVKRRCVEAGVEAALSEAPRPGAARKLSGTQQALLVATACTAPPAGRARWTLELLAGRMVALTAHAMLSRETVRRCLHEQALKPWLRKMWCIPKLDTHYIARMEDVLDVYAQPPDEQRPVVCFDEASVQLVAESRVPVPAAPGRPARQDYEYERRGTANLFMHFDAARGWRHVKVTPTRTSADFAQCVRELLDVHYPKAERIRLVLDNLSTHSEAALYQSLPACEALRLLKRIEWHYTPKHASWLNQVEIEIGVLRQQCLDRRIATREALDAEVQAWAQARNAERATIHWHFTCERARQKMVHAYPDVPDTPAAKAA